MVRFSIYLKCRLCIRSGWIHTDDPRRTLFDSNSDEAIPRLRKFKPQGIFNTVWAFATAGESNQKFFKEVAEVAIPRLRKFNPQDLPNTVWAFATARESNHNCSMRLRRLLFFEWESSMKRPWPTLCGLLQLPKYHTLYSLGKSQKHFLVLLPRKRYSLGRVQAIGTFQHCTGFCNRQSNTATTLRGSSRFCHDNMNSYLSMWPLYIGLINLWD